MDSGLHCDGGELTLTLGETVSGKWHPLEASTEPMLVHGPQGGHHLALAVQLEGLGELPSEVLFDIEALDVHGQSLGGFVRILPDPRLDDEPTAIWLDVWLVVHRWPVAESRSISVMVEELTPCARTATWDLTLQPS